MRAYANHTGLGWGCPAVGGDAKSGYISGCNKRWCKVDHRAQKRAIESYRARLTERGIVRFELQAFEADRALIRTVARKLVEEGPDGGPIRRMLQQAGGGAPRAPGGIVAALRRSPLVGRDLDLTRPRDGGRDVEL